MIKVANLSKSFAHNTVLKNINIHVPKNSVYGFLGNNGAGKSTLIRTLLGLLKADKGHIMINGKAIKYTDFTYKNDIGSLIDSPCLYLNLTPHEYLTIACRCKKLHQREIDKALILVNMKSCSHIQMSKFSLGMKQRVAIAVALLGSPKLLILDEPTNGLDPIGMQEIRALLRSLPNKIDTTVFLSSHLLDEIQKTATHIGILHQGEIKLESSLSDVLKKASSSLDISTNKPKKLTQFLIDNNHKASIKNGSIVCIDDVKYPQCSRINQHIISSGFDLNESRFNQPSLEKFFIDLVGTKTSGAQDDV